MKEKTIEPNEETVSADPTFTVTEQFRHVLILPIILIAFLHSASLFTHYTLLLQIIAHITLIITVSVYALRFHIHWKIAGFVGAITGLSTVFIVALLRLLVGKQVIYFFAIFTEPVFAGMLDGLAVSFIVLVWPSLFKN